MNKTYNIYCDESCHLENDHKDFMFLGSITAAYHQVKFHSENIREIKAKHKFFGEIKWSNVSKSKLGFYLDLIDYFFATDLKFRAVGVIKSKIRNDDFGQSYDDFYYKMYYLLLNHKVDTFASYNVYLDIKDTLSAYKVHKLKNILNTQYEVFRNVQNIRSHESLIMQITDLIMGAISYKNNMLEQKNTAKIHLINKIEQLSKEKMDCTNYSEKMNLFFIELK